MWVWGFGNHKWYKSLDKSRVADEWLDKRLLFHEWFPKPHTHISALTALALLKTTNKRYEITNEMRYLFERNEIFKHFGQCTHMWLHCVNAVSRKCEYGVLEITSDTKVLLSHESQTSDLTKDFCFTTFLLTAFTHCKTKLVLLQ